MKQLSLFFLLIAAMSSIVLGENVPLTDNGFIPLWTVAGSLPYHVQDAQGKQLSGYYYDFLSAAGGEKQAVPTEGDRIEFEETQSVEWKTGLINSSGVLNFVEIFKVAAQSQGVAYAFCQLHSEEAQDVVLKVRSNDGVRVWVNTDLVHDNHVSRTLNAIPDQVSVTLKKGTNRLLAKVDQMGGGWELSIAVAGQDDKPAEGITTSISSSNAAVESILSVEFSASPLVLKTPQGERQILRAEITSGGLKEVTCRISSSAWPQPERFQLGDIPIGTHVFEFNVPILTEDGTIDATLQSSSGEKNWSNIPLSKPRQWTVYLVQHVHTDIGYTRPQTDILAEHLRYIDYALDFCDLTDDYPDDAKFRWTCEISWAVREYLNRRPAQQIARLKKRVDEGRIEMAGMFLNMSEIATESSMAASLQPVRQFKDEYGIPVCTAMQNDVNGAAWCLVDYFSDMGIRYLVMGINNTRSVLPFDKPTVFRWESPSGKWILGYRADHYHTGNMWKIHEGNVGVFKENLLNYLRSLERRDYPFDRISAQYSGYQTDNSPPAMIECDLIDEWNKTYAWPKLRSATAREFMEYVEKNHADELPVHRQAWPDWWTDGFGSAARETAASRQTHNSMRVTETLFSMARLLGASVSPDVMERAAAVQEDLLFYDEHTYGAAESISDPMADNTMVQWGEKSSYAWEAVKKAGMLREEALGLLQGFIPRANVPVIAVFNTLNWKRSGLIEVFIDHEIIPPDKPSRIIDTETGETVPAQRLRQRTEGSFWALWVKDVPSLGYKVYRIEGSGPKPRPSQSTDSAPTAVENRYYRLTLNPDTAAITSFFDKELNRELVEQDSEWNVGQLIYEELSGGRDFNSGTFHRSTLNNPRIQPGTDGPIWKSVDFSGEMKGCAGVKGEIRLYETCKRVDLLYSIRKLPVTDAESVYVSFPFSCPDGTIVYEAQGGLVTPGKDQIPGSSSDWQTVQNFISVRNPNGQILIGSNEIPLVQFGDINLGKWQEIATVKKPHIFSWILNNYWFTNFRASQEGEIKWSYYLTSIPNTDNVSATRFGWGARIPLVPRVLPSSVKGQSDYPLSMSTLAVDAPNVVLVDAKPAKYTGGVVLHFRELDGKPAICDLQKAWQLSGNLRVDEVNVIEEPLKENVSSISFAPFECKFVNIRMAK
ncbi:MAG: glycoside hydrolase family 38 C-terminal domain-containing protein [bacterium]